MIDDYISKAFHFATDGDPDLNLFSEIDVEEEFKERGTFRGVVNTLTAVDSLQRSMRDAKPGDRIQAGGHEIVCVRLNLGMICENPQLT